jgi:hypothetical protein
LWLSVTANGSENSIHRILLNPFPLVSQLIHINTGLPTI